MTIKEAILVSLEDFPNGAPYNEIFENILEKRIFTFNKDAKTPKDTVSALLGDFIRNGDSRVRRYKNENKVFCYYLAKYENESVQEEEVKSLTALKKQKDTFHERDLHPLLCAFLASKGIMAKTIFHEKSNKQEEHQKWLHPDIVGAKFTEYKDNICNSLFKALSPKESLELYSYELKKEIDNDYELKKCFFQAVSNSSWANFGYLVAFDINEKLRDEIERLNHSFGIGFIQLKANPYESQIWFFAKKASLDFNTIDKLCKINADFAKFTQLVEATVTANEKYFASSKNDLLKACDEYLSKESEIKNYCASKNIPWVDEGANEEYTI